MVGFINSIMPASVGFSLFHKYCIFIFSPQHLNKYHRKKQKTKSYTDFYAVDSRGSALQESGMLSTLP
jgi:hypothetical protein